MNAEREENGLNYSRETTIMCGLSKGVDGHWRVSLLSEKLQEIIRKYPDHFAGAPPPEQEKASTPSTVSTNGV